MGVAALASPVVEVKRYLVTEVVMETATITVTASSTGRSWSKWTGKHGPPGASNTLSVIDTTSSIPIVSVPTTSQAAVPTTLSTSTIPSTSEAPVPAPSSSSSTAPAAQPSSDTSAGLSSYAQPIIDQHNLHRRNHSAVDIAWNQTLANIAQQIAESCDYKHNTQAGGGGYGQNIGAGSTPEQVDAMITNAMYNNEMMLYPGYGSEPDMSNFEGWGHFSQIVWAGTTSVGCYTQQCTGGLSNVGPGVQPYFTVCNYFPVGKCSTSPSLCLSLTSLGNMGGTYAANVLKPEGQPVVTI